MSYCCPQKGFVCAAELAVATLLTFGVPSVGWSHVTLRSPNGGEQLAGGDVFTVQWLIDVPHNTLDWDLWYSDTSVDGPWEVLAENLTFADNSGGQLHSFEWIVPNLEVPAAWVRVRQDNTAEDYFDVSNASFAIAAVRPGADFTGNGAIDGIDLANWEEGYGISGGATPSQGDADLDTDVDGADFLAWQSELEMGESPFSPISVPEPEATLLLALGIGLMLWWHR